MPGSKRSSKGSAISALYKLIEWVFYYFFLNYQTKIHIWLTFKTKPQNLRAFNAETTWRREQPLYLLSVQASTLALIIYYQLPSHPLTLPTAIGGGLSAVLILRSIEVMIQRYIAR